MRRGWRGSFVLIKTGETSHLRGGFVVRIAIEIEIEGWFNSEEQLVYTFEHGWSCPDVGGDLPVAPTVPTDSVNVSTNIEPSRNRNQYRYRYRNSFMICFSIAIATPSLHWLSVFN